MYRLHTPSCLPLVVSLLLVLCGAPPTVRAGEPPAAVEPVFEVLEVDGRVSSGRITAVAADRIGVASAEGANREIPLTALVKLSRQDGRARAAEGADVVLPDGDRLVNVIIGPATDVAVEVHSYALGKMSVPLDAVLGLIMTPPTDAEALDRLWRRIRNRAARQRSRLAGQRRPGRGDAPGDRRPSRPDPG